MLGEEPPYLLVGTEVSAKYKGAFCEAKVRKVDKLVKCKIAFKLGFGSHTVLDNQLKGTPRVGASVEARHPEKKEFVEGIITKIQDCSQYTVVFDDGDITTLRRSALCQKSGRHFAESETLDQLPLTHPEHFGNPVVGRGRGTRKRLGSEDSSGEEVARKGKPREEREREVGKVICVELGDKKKGKDNWFPGLVVSPAAQDTVRIRVKEEYLVRSFKDARYYTVPKKEAAEFTKEIGSKVENSSLKTAVEKALTFINKDELPPHWDRDQLFCDEDSEDSESDPGMESDSSDDEPREEKDHFVAQLYKFMDDRGTPINACPSVCSRDLDLYKLFKVVHKLNGYNRVSNNNQWKLVSTKLAFGYSPGVVSQVKHAYKRYLHSFEDFYRKLGCTMVNHPRPGRSRSQRGRPLIRDKDRSTPVKNEPGPSSKRDEDVPVNEMPFASEVSTPIAKDDELISEKNELSDPELRPISSMRKKCPIIKASPRTKDESPVVKRRSEVRPPSTRQKRIPGENSTEEVHSSGEDSKTSVIDEQRSSTRAKTKEDTAKQIAKKEKEVNDSRRVKSTMKNSDCDASKKAQKMCDDVKKTADGPKRQRSVTDEPAIKRSRKRLNTDNGSEVNVPARPCIPRNKSIVVGDILKVYYGSPSEPNGIYEAKVVDVDEDDSKEQIFLVHYAGWNSRYDEWVKRNKIAENVTGTTRRSKTSPAKGGPGRAKRKAAGKSDPPRSSTPSSITSSSSLSKSPATPVTRRRPARSATVGATTRRSRRTSHTEEASIDSESEMDSDNGTASDSETKSDNQNSVTANPRCKAVLKRFACRTQLKKCSSILEPTADVVEKKKPRLLKKDESDPSINPKNLESIDDLTIKLETESQSIDSDLRKGRDFDLNEIRSELKGIDKAVKVAGNPEAVAEEQPGYESVEEGEITLFAIEESSTTSTIPNPPPPSLPQGPITSIETSVLFKQDESEQPLKQELDQPEGEDQQLLLQNVKEQADGDEHQEMMADEVDKPSVNDLVLSEETQTQAEEIKDDIYEFKEPEPFEFQEVRRPIRIFDDSPEKSVDKSVTQKAQSSFKVPEKILVENPQEDIKVRFRRAVGKKMRTSLDDKKDCSDVKAEIEDVASADDSLSEHEDSIPPQLVAVPPINALDEIRKDWNSGQVDTVGEPGVDTDTDEQSPEPPCLIPFTPPVPHTHTTPYDLHDPPRLTTEASSSDSESEERLVIDNDGVEETSTANKAESSHVDDVTTTAAVTTSVSTNVLRKETKRNPLVDVRLKRLEERFKLIETQKDDESLPQDQQLQQLAIVNDDDREIEDGLIETREERSSAIRSLVCDEVIPGSPTARDANDEICLQATSTSLIENTPPTTPPTSPESNVSSPREDRMDKLYQRMELSPQDNDSSKSHRDSSDQDQDEPKRSIKYEKRSKKGVESSIKRRKCRRRSEGELARRAVGRATHRRRDARENQGSDSDTSEHSFSIQPDSIISNRSPRPSKFNFCKEMAPDMDSNQKIAFLYQQLQEIKNMHAALRNVLASIERKKKKQKRKKRDEKLAMATTEVPTHPAPTADPSPLPLAAFTRQADNVCS